MVIYSADIASIGLLLDIIGCFLIWRFGLPADVNRHGTIVIACEQTDENEKTKGKRYDLTAMIGFFVLVVGFGLQLTSSMLLRSASLQIHPASIVDPTDKKIMEQESSRP